MYWAELQTRARLWVMFSVSAGWVGLGGYELIFLEARERGIPSSNLPLSWFDIFSTDTASLSSPRVWPPAEWLVCFRDCLDCLSPTSCRLDPGLVSLRQDPHTPQSSSQSLFRHGSNRLPIARFGN